MTEPESPIVLAADWHVEIHVAGVDQNRPGVYEWRIEGVGVYIGQYTRTSRPRREYGKNVSNILNGRPYRKGKVEKFRVIHRELARAVQDGRRITLSLIENVEDKVARNRREQETIALRRIEARSGGLPVLNSIRPTEARPLATVKPPGLQR